MGKGSGPPSNEPYSRKFITELDLLAVEATKFQGIIHREMLLEAKQFIQSKKADGELTGDYDKDAYYCTLSKFEERVKIVELTFEKVWGRMGLHATIPQAWGDVDSKIDAKEKTTVVSKPVPTQSAKSKTLPSIPLAVFINHLAPYLNTLDILSISFVSHSCRIFKPRNLSKRKCMDDRIIESLPTMQTGWMKFQKIQTNSVAILSKNKAVIFFTEKSKDKFTYANLNREYKNIEPKDNCCVIS